MDQLWLWIGFNLVVLAMLALDLFVFHREAYGVWLKAPHRPYKIPEGLALGMTQTSMIRLCSGQTRPWS
jgi:hypothetical protein